MLVTVLAGGVGAARFLDGLVRVVSPGDVTVIGNVGDDVEVLGLHVSPDLDTVVYTLAGLVEPDRGWGRTGDTASALAVVSQLGGEDWFFLSDGDIGLHLVRTERLRRGEPLSAIMRDVCDFLGVGITLLPVTDDTLRTLVATDEGELDFQTYFVRRRHEDDVRAVRYAGAWDARPAPGVVDAIESADVVVVAPSNPFLSVEPILAVPGIREALERRARPVVGVSPIVAGRAIKGPADRMLRALVGDASPLAVAERYADFLTHMLVDTADAGYVASIEELGIRAGAAATLMSDPSSRPAVAQAALDLAADMLAT